MDRNSFLKTLLGASTLMTMDGFSTLANAISYDKQDKNKSSEFASYGAVHLNNTDLERASQFWTKIVGMKQRNRSDNRAEFGTETKTLVVVNQTAATSFMKGYSGLYHLAIHAPNKAEFASMINRLNAYRYPYSPINHTMSKSVYLDDPDGINVEFALETPEEFKRVVSTGGLKIEGADGIIRSASERLDVNKILEALEDNDVNKAISDDTYIGHLHLYANNVANSNSFYKKLGFTQFNYLPQFMYADVGAGGDYQHRVAMNSWHGMDRPLAPKESAGMRHFQINYKSEKKLCDVIKNIDGYQEEDGGYWVYDPTGNKIFLTHNS